MFLRIAPLLAVAAVALIPRRSEAQTSAGALIAAARAQMDEFGYDSARVLLNRALEARSGATTGERVRAYYLFGINELNRVENNRDAAQRAFVEALRLDPTLRIDSLEALQSSALLVFGEARTIMGPVALPGARSGMALTVLPTLPGDTDLAASGEALRVAGQPSYRARVVFTVSPAAVPTQVVWSDTQRVDGLALAWDLRGRDGQLVAPARYTLSMKAIDSLGQVSPVVERVLQFSRAPVDTQPAPSPPTFAAESLRLRGSPVSLLLGIGLGAAAVALPAAMGSSDLNAGLKADGTSYVVAGAVSLAGIAGFLAGHRVRPIPENIQRNRDARSRYEQEIARVTQLNARARENAPVHVHVEEPGR